MTITSEEELAGLLAIGRIIGLTIQHMAQQMTPGMTTGELDAIGGAFLESHGARSAPILAYKFPGATCISINDEAAHGIPGDRLIQPGDLVNIDVSAEMDGYWADSGRSFGIPPIKPRLQRMLDATLHALEIGIKRAQIGKPAHVVGRAIEIYAQKQGFQTLVELGGHGVGRHLHEPPSVPNHFDRRARQRFKPGMVVTIEPFLTTGGRHIYTADDGWTLKTTDGSLACQAEHTIVINENGPIVVTQV